jgi:hypothetical protein
MLLAVQGLIHLVMPHLDSATEDLSAGWFAEQGLCKLWNSNHIFHVLGGPAS